MPRLCSRCLLLVLLALLPAARGAAAPPVTRVDGTLEAMRGLIERFSADRAALGRFYDTPDSEIGRVRNERFLASWRNRLNTVDFDALPQDGRVDYLLFRNLLDHELGSIEHERLRAAEAGALVPFADAIVVLQEIRRQLKPVDAQAVAVRLDQLAGRVRDTHDDLKRRLREAGDAEALGYERTTANRAAGTVRRLRDTLRRWYRFYDGYDPLFTWWVQAPYEELSAALDDYRGFLRRALVGIGEDDDEAIIGDPTGREELLDRLRHAMIPYTPEELLVIAEREYAWCRAEMLKASQDLGFGDDWRRALEHVKTLHVEPGRQPELIRDLAWEAIEFLEDRDLLTIPALCRETWRMEMMSPARQKTSPYFLGGETIIVSFPTSGMAHDDKLMSMRGNNVHFARATVHHELIPGHHLQGFMTRRYRTHRRIFSTPFWGEGWALYWEMLLWDLEFPQSPENRVGMLFWRMHRCARIVFSLSFHLDKMTAEEAIDYLVENVGHERNNATAEVRRSVSGAYGPLYQAAYMLGGLQFRALHREMVGSGRMTDREFHDAVLRHNSIPVEMVRAALGSEPLQRDFTSTWRFYGDVAVPE
jgi:hypothetical protein